MDDGVTVVVLSDSQGPEGAQGPPGPAGPAGASGDGLPGGTTGQVLSKASNANNDTRWHSITTIDIVDAGTAIAANITDFDPAGAAGTAITSHLASVDPHGDRAYTNSHIASTTNVHGIPDTSALVNTTNVTEIVQDIVGALIVAGANIATTYNDTTGVLSIGINGLTESVQDIVGTFIVGTNGISAVYDDTSNVLTLSITDGSIAISKLAVDPLLRSNHTGTQSYTTITGLGTAANADISAFDSAGTATSVVSNHVANADPHTQYQKESEKGQPNGYASLGGDGLVPSSQLPAAGGVATHGATHISTGTDPIPNATTTVSGLLSGADKTKLNGVATGATANATDAQLRDRSTHTGTQLSSTISDLTESVQDVIGAFSSGTSPITVTYDDTANTLVFSIANGSITNAKLATQYQQQSEKGQPSGYASLDGSGLIPSAQLPPLAISNIFVVASQAAMLALSAQEGDVAIRTDQSKTYILATSSPTTLGDWKEIVAAGAVTSVDGRSGTISLSDLYDASGAATSAVSTHVAAADPHTQYQKRSEKGQLSGYASLDGSGKVPTAQVPDLSSTYVATSTRGAASGVATLDASGLLTVGQRVPWNTTALGDGTTDDTAALVADLSANTTVILKPGATYLTGAFTIAAGKTLNLNGATLKTKANLGTAHVTLLKGGTIQNGFIDGNRTNQSSSANAINLTSSTSTTADRYVIDNVFIKDVKTYGISGFVTNGEMLNNLVIRGCTFKDMSGTGIQLSASYGFSTSTDVSITDCHFNNCDAAGLGGHGLSIYSDGAAFTAAVGYVVFFDIVVANNVCYNSTTSINIEIMSTRNAVITGNTVDGGTQGIATARLENSSVTGNTIRACSNALEINSASGLVVDGNILDGGSTCILLSGAATGLFQDIVIENNVVTGGVYGINSTTQSMTRLKIANNLFRDLTSGCIRQESYPWIDCSIVDNTFIFTTAMSTGSNRRAIALRLGATRVAIERNIISVAVTDTAGGTGGLIDIGNGPLTDVSIRGNNIRGVGLVPLICGIRVDAATTHVRTVIADNIIDQFDVGIYTLGVTGSVLRRNVITRCTSWSTFLVAGDLLDKAANYEGTAIPTTGTWAIGDRVWNSAPAASSPVGWVCTIAGTPGTWKAMADLDLNLKPLISGWYDATTTTYGLATANTASANTTAIQAAIDAAYSAGGGVIYIPRGTYSHNGFTMKTGVILRGVGGVSVSSGLASVLQYTGTGSASAVDCRGASGMQIEDIALTATSTSWSGRMLDLRISSTATPTATSFVTVRNCYIGYSLNTAATLIDLNGGQEATIQDCHLDGGLYGVHGKTINSDQSNNLAVLGCVFHRQTTAHIHNPGQAWRIESCVFEGLVGGGAAGVICDSGVKVEALSIRSCWSGDATGGTVYKIEGDTVVIDGNWIGATSGIGISTPNVVTGLKITNNKFVGCTDAIRTVQPSGSSSALGWLVLGNEYQSVTNRLTGAYATGTISHDGQANNGATNTGLLISGFTSNGSVTFNDNVTATGAFVEGSTIAGAYIGIVNSTPRLMLANGTQAQNWQIDNNSGTFRWLTPGIVQLQLGTGSTAQLPQSGASLAIGPNAAATGALRFPNNVGVYFRDSTNATNVGPVLTVDSSDQVIITQSNSAKNITFKVASTAVCVVTSTAFTLTGDFTGNTVAVTGLTGATAASRHAGATASGAPASGTFITGDVIVDQAGRWWICTAGGSPGAWVGTDKGLTTGTSYLSFGTGSPEGAITAAVGSWFFRTDGGIGRQAYIKSSGTGNTGWKLQGQPTLSQFFADAGNTTTTETDLNSLTLGGSQLASGGECVVARYSGTLVNSASTKQLRVYFGGTVIYDSTAMSSTATGNWDIDVLVMRESSSAVRCSTVLRITGATGGTVNQYTNVTGLTLSATQIIKVTGQAAGGTAATNDIVAKFGRIEYRPAS